MNNKFLIYYIFIEALNEIIIKNILILKNKKYRLNIITSEKSAHQISKFVKMYGIKVYVIDNSTNQEAIEENSNICQANGFLQLLPVKGNIESLNASAAAAIIMFERNRQLHNI